MLLFFVKFVKLKTNSMRNALIYGTDNKVKLFLLKLQWHNKGLPYNFLRKDNFHLNFIFSLYSVFVK